jgi:hypothetical protein
MPTTADNPRRININETCSLVSVNIRTTTAPSVGIHYIKIQDTYDEMPTYIPVTAGMISNTNGGSPYYITATITTNAEGLVRVDHAGGNLAESGVFATFYTIAPCKVECCIANLTESAINCNCNCGKCAEDLERATKVSLLLQGATYLAEQETPDPSNAEKLYLKAVQLCEEVCACGC